MKTLLNKLYIILFSLLIITACGGSTEEDPSDSDAINGAWNLFEQGSYAEARDAFAAIATSSEVAAGLGWSNLRLGDFSTAVSNFASSTSIDAGAGATFALWAQANYAGSILSGEAVIASNANYVFSHDSSVTIEDIHLHIAYSHFHLANYADAISSIQDLDGSFTADANDPGIEQTLLTKLEALKLQYD